MELFSRRRSSTKSPSSGNQRSSTSSTIGGTNGIDNAPSSPIPTISSRRSSQSVVFVRTPSMLSTSASQPPYNSERKKSKTGSDVSDKSDASKNTKKRRISNVLTSSFLRRKRAEYAGMDYLSQHQFVQPNIMHHPLSAFPSWNTHWTDARA